MVLSDGSFGGCWLQPFALPNSNCVKFPPPPSRVLPQAFRPDTWGRFLRVHSRQVSASTGTMRRETLFKLNGGNLTFVQLLTLAVEGLVGMKGL